MPDISLGRDARDILYALSNDRNVVLDAGEYVVSDRTILPDGCTLSGAPGGGTIIKAMRNGQFINAGSFAFENLKFKGFQNLVSNADATAKVNVEISSCRFEDCLTVITCSGTGGVGTATIQNCQAEGFARFFDLDCDVLDKLDSSGNNFVGWTSPDIRSDIPDYLERDGIASCFVYRIGKANVRDSNSIGIITSQNDAISNIFHRTGRADGFFVNGARQLVVRGLKARNLAPSINIFLEKGFNEYSNEDNTVGGAVYSAATETIVEDVDIVDGGVAPITCNAHCETMTVSGTIRDGQGWGRYGIYDRSERGVLTPTVIGFPQASMC